ncbi:hypothetical protein KKH00_01890, partial [Patescibacteria group bacterium]|nr:hypothetical protein [Patescibacteria group bacterium]
MRRIIKLTKQKSTKSNKIVFNDFQQNKQFIYFCLIVLIILGISISFQSILAEWVNPDKIPPDGNLSAPINVSGVAQYKLGKLSIGTSENPSQTLEVRNDVNDVASTSRIRITDINQNPELQLQYGNDTDNDHWGIYNNTDNSLNIWGGDNRLTILQNGNIGIGTTSPTAKLEIASPSSTEGLRIISASDQSPLNIRNNANTYDIFRVNEYGVLKVGSVPWERLSSLPSACPAGQYVSAIGSTLTCSTPSSTVYTAGTGISIDVNKKISSTVIGNTGTVTSITAGTGLTGETITSSGTFALNLANANTWTGAQTLNNANLILNGTSAMNFNQTTAVMNFNATANPAYINSNRGIQLRLDADNNTTDEFAINNGSNLKVFSIN